MPHLCNTHRGQLLVASLLCMNRMAGLEENSRRGKANQDKGVQQRSTSAGASAPQPVMRPFALPSSVLLQGLSTS